jgi:hypothetical protein
MIFFFFSFFSFINTPPRRREKIRASEFLLSEVVKWSANKLSYADGLGVVGCFLKRVRFDFLNFILCVVGQFLLRFFIQNSSYVSKINDFCTSLVHVLYTISLN